jgi:hypothetical protein
VSGIPVALLTYLITADRLLISLPDRVFHEESVKEHTVKVDPTENVHAQAVSFTLAHLVPPTGVPETSSQKSSLSLSSFELEVLIAIFAVTLLVDPKSPGASVIFHCR